MERIDMKKRVKMGRHNPYRRHETFVGRLRTMLVFADGNFEDNDSTVLFYVYHDLPDSRGRYQQIADLCLTNDICENAYHVDLMRVNSVFQGFSFAPMLYSYIMKKFGIVIQAGEAQSAGGRKIWSKLCKMKNVIVFGTSGRKFVQMDVDEETGELCADGAAVYSDGRSRFKTFAYYQG